MGKWNEVLEGRRGEGGTHLGEEVSSFIYFGNRRGEEVEDPPFGLLFILFFLGEASFELNSLSLSPPSFPEKPSPKKSGGKRDFESGGLAEEKAATQKEIHRETEKSHFPLHS